MIILRASNVAKIANYVNSAFFVKPIKVYACNDEFY